MLKPATISDSASNRSKGARLTSACAAMRNSSAASGAEKTNHTSRCAATIPFSPSEPESSTGTSSESTSGTS
jgi:hypothetical protein